MSWLDDIAGAVSALGFIHETRADVKKLLPGTKSSRRFNVITDDFLEPGPTFGMETGRQDTRKAELIIRYYDSDGNLFRLESTMLSDESVIRTALMALQTTNIMLIGSQFQTRVERPGEEKVRYKHLLCTVYTQGT